MTPTAASSPSSAPVDKRQTLPPCQAACPIGQDVQGYVARISQGQFDDALAVIRQTNPLPSICGFVCAQPCQAYCRRDTVDQAIAIRALKRAATEYGRNRPAVTETIGIRIGKDKAAVKQTSGTKNGTGSWR